MPLMKGKSEKAFGHNVAAEMHAGKPQKQSLAIAYAVKRRMGKKMAAGGMVPKEDLAKEHDPIMHNQAQGNEDLHPGLGLDKAKNMLMAEQHLSHEKLSHGQLPHPAEPSEHITAHPNLDAEHFAMGGIAERIMAKKKMAMGDVDHYDEGGIVEVPEHLQDQEVDDDHMVAEGMPLMDYSKLPEEEENPLLKRKGMISKIMSELHSKHLGK